MTARQKFERWLVQSLRIANLKAAIAVQGFVLVVGTMLIAQNYYGGDLLFAVIFIALETACVVILESRLQLASYLIAIPNLLLSISFGAFGSWHRPFDLLWMFSTGLMALVCLFVSRMPAYEAQENRSPPP